MASSKPLKIQLEEQIWHPHIGWQVLRRSKRYQEAVKRFKESAIALEGPDGLGCYALTYAGFDAPYIKDTRTKLIEAGSPTPLRVRMGQENIEDMLFVGDWEIAPKFEQAMATDYCKKFVDEFGYVLRFPIEPEVENPNPNPAFLNYLWRMYPAAEYSSDDLLRLKRQFNFEKEGLTDLHFLIDWNFSFAMVFWPSFPLSTFYEYTSLP